MPCYPHSGPVVRVLLFNATGDRDCAAMLKLLVVSEQCVPILVVLVVRLN